MTKTELINKVAEHTGHSKKDTEAIINETFTTIVNSLIQRDNVQIIGFGTFMVHDKEARKGRNPSTGEAIDIPATRVAKFKPGKTLRNAVSLK